MDVPCPPHLKEQHKMELRQLEHESLDHLKQVSHVGWTPLLGYQQTFPRALPAQVG